MWDSYPHSYLCVSHGGSPACEDSNKRHGLTCPRCEVVHVGPNEGFTAMDRDGDELQSFADETYMALDFDGYSVYRYEIPLNRPNRNERQRQQHPLSLIGDIRRLKSKVNWKEEGF